MLADPILALIGEQVVKGRVDALPLGGSMSASAVLHTRTGRYGIAQREGVVCTAVWLRIMRSSKGMKASSIRDVHHRTWLQVNERDVPSPRLYSFSGSLLSAAISATLRLFLTAS